jgi:hypothetical protein
MLIHHVEDCAYVCINSSMKSLMEIQEVVSASYFHTSGLFSASTYTS